MKRCDARYDDDKPCLGIAVAVRQATVRSRPVGAPESEEAYHTQTWAFCLDHAAEYDSAKSFRIAP